MSFSTELFIGFRHLRSRSKLAFVSLTTWISVLGIALGVATLIVVVGVMTGFQREFRDKILGTQSHIVITRSGASLMRNWQDVLQKARQHEGVVAASPFVYGQAMFSFNNRVLGAVVRGIVPDREIDVTDIRRYLKDGSLEKILENNSEGKPGVIIGAELAKNLFLKEGDTVMMVSPVGVVTPMGLVPRTKKFQVVGIFRSGFYQYDAGLSFISMKESQVFFGFGKSVTGVHLRVEDIFSAERISRKIQGALSGAYLSRSWQEMNRNLFSALKTEKTTLTILLLLVVVVAAFNIIGSLVMVVMEKGREIAILKSMGATSGAILRIFFVQGAFIGLVGAVLGTGGGLVLGWNLHVVEDFLERAFGLDILPPSVYHIEKLPVQMTPFDVSVTAVVAFIICLAATLYPAWRASRVDPVENLRYG
ncbi:MAG: lipoprotein-releasing ABC transporter permease subunit [Nitrospinae bacterium]|nr:lipoprotein-releasing ABC transporter permease subunit [Nitrospinota bacterium]